MCILRDEDCTLSGHEVVSLRADFPEIFNAYDAIMTHDADEYDDGGGSGGGSDGGSSSGLRRSKRSRKEGWGKSSG
jgi:hypothetical protein